MATVKEMMMDAAASIETAAMMSAGDTFEGTLSRKFDEDWIRIEMTAGMLYTINLSGRNVDLDPATDSDGEDGTADNDNDGVADTFLRLYDSKGGFIKQNDDIKGEEGNLNSSFQFIPEVSGYLLHQRRRLYRQPWADEPGRLHGDGDGDACGVTGPD